MIQKVGKFRQYIVYVKAILYYVYVRVVMDRMVAENLALLNFS